MKSSAAARPVAPREFAAAMAALGPFESKPHLALAVSGGADSLALAYLAAQWARRRGGAVTALTVDHRLRPEAAAEARRVKRWLLNAGITHRTLVWNTGADAPRRGIQARARAARYDLLEGWCARQGVLHLLTAHHRDDQAETFLLRLAAISGSRGLAAMATVRELTHARLLRPLLFFPRARLEATLAARGQDWIDDPSNLDPAYARVRLRALAPVLDDAGLGSEQRAALAARFAAVRRALDGALADRLARSCAPHPAGFVRIARDAFLAGPASEGVQGLARVLCAVSGADYAPRRERLERLYRAIAAPGFRGATLGGCRVLALGRDHLLACREAAAQAAPMAIKGTRVFHWDGRFFVRLVGQGRGYRLGALGADGWRQVVSDRPDLAKTSIPTPVRAVLPALFRGSRPVAVPHIGYGRSNARAATLRFAEIRPMVAVALAGPRISAPSGAC